MNLIFLKRRFYDLRLGGTAISPIIQMANFVGISFLYVREYLPFEIFAPLFVVCGVASLSYIGARYRKHQAVTDYDMVFEKQKTQAKVLYQLLLAIKNGKTDKDFDECLEYLKKISD